jgi:transposase
MSKIVLGIDVSKRDLSLALLENKRFISKTVSNSELGFKEIVTFISSKKHEKLKIYLEATGNYSITVADYLVDHGFDVKVVNPLKIHAHAESKLSRSKTDKADAKLIADYGSKEEEISYKKLPENMKKLKCLYRAYVDFKKHATMCKNHLENSEDKDVSDHWRDQLASLNAQIKKIIKQILGIINADKYLFLNYKKDCCIKMCFTLLK